MNVSSSSSSETISETHLAFSQIKSNCSLSLSNDKFVQSGRTEKFVSHICKETQLNKKTNKTTKNQLQHELELLKIELSKKDHVIDNLKSEHMSQLHDIDEKLKDALFEKQHLQSQLENSVCLHKAELNSLEEKYKNDFKMISCKQEQLEKENKECQDQVLHVREKIETSVLITKERYIKLKSTSADKLSVDELFSIKMYENMECAMQQCKKHVEMENKLSSDIVKLTNALHETEHELINERSERTRLYDSNRCQEIKLKELKNKLDASLDKIKHFDIIMAERNKFEHECGILTQVKNCLETEISKCKKENTRLKNEIQTLHQEIILLKQNREYLNKTLCDLKEKLKDSENNLTKAIQKIESITHSRERMFEKYVSSTEEARMKYEQSLQSELCRLKIKNEKELEKVRADSKVAYERESKKLCEARDAAVLERGRIIKQKNEVEKLCESFSKQIRILESNFELIKSESQSSAHVTCKTFDKVQKNNEIMTSKLQFVTENFLELQRKSSFKESSLQSQINELKKKLNVYEFLEEDANNNTIQTAAKQQDEAGCSYKTKAPITAKESVQLTEKIFNLEKTSSWYCRQKDDLTEEIEELRRRLEGKGEDAGGCKPADELRTGRDEAKRQVH